MKFEEIVKLKRYCLTYIGVIVDQYYEIFKYFKKKFNPTMPANSLFRKNSLAVLVLFTIPFAISCRPLSILIKNHLYVFHQCNDPMARRKK